MSFKSGSLYVFCVPQGYWIGKVIVPDKPGLVQAEIEEPRILFNGIEDNGRVVTHIVPLPGFPKNGHIPIPSNPIYYEPSDAIKKLWIKNVLGIVVPDLRIEGDIRAKTQ